MNKNIKKFQESITKELNVVKDRVRNLIADSHWGEEGRYKEAILRNVIKNFLPENLSLGTGFVIRKNGGSSTEISKQIDLIIYDNSIPALFKEGDFIITTPQNVRGIIEVKTKIENSQFQDTTRKAEQNGKLIGNQIFNGIFSYEYSSEISNNNVPAQIQTSLESAEGFVNHISLGPDYFIRFWRSTDADRLSPSVDNNGRDFYNIYGLDNLSFSYFISNLIEMTCTQTLRERYWFLYPIEGSKETQRIKTIPIPNR